MRTLYFMGPNPENVSGKSFKMWRVARRGRTIQIWWGRATVDKSRRVVPAQELQSKTWTCRSEAAAISDVENRVSEKIREGYSPEKRRT